MQTPEPTAAAGQPAMPHSALRWISSFIAEWQANVAGHPCIPCDVLHLHQAFHRWCHAQGNPRDADADSFTFALRFAPVRLVQLPDLTVVVPAAYVAQNMPLSLESSLVLFAVHLQGLSSGGLGLLQAKTLLACKTCNGRKKWRPPYSPTLEACPDCTAVPSAASTASGAASEKPAGISA